MKLKCLLTRHHWLLQGHKPISIYAENDKTAEAYYFYECQVCGKIMKQLVHNLDNAPKEQL